MTPRRVRGLAALALLGLLVPVQSPPPSRAAGGDATISAPGLSAPVTLVTDRWGIPHLRARSLPDLYFAWGYVTARDRLWQLMHDRQAGRGALWQWVGNSALRGDGGAQLFELGARADRIWERERRDPAVREPLERYAAGINAWLARCRAGEEPWPRELQRLGVQPADWQPADSYLILLGLGITLDLEVPELTELPEVRAHGLPWTTARRRFESQWIYDTVPDSAARRIYGTGAPAPAPTGRRGRRSAAAAGLGVDAGALAAAIATLEALSPGTDPEGAARASNEFAVGAGRSASGAPLLANDPHLSLVTPGEFHVLHVSVPGMVDAIGASVPGLPAIVSGRNLGCAWGVTALSADMIDVYADTLSADGRRVRWKGGWAPVREVPFDMRFKALGLPLPVFGQTRRYTPHGPVLVWDRKQRLALSARWSAMEDERITLARLIGVERSTSAAEIAARYRSLVTPGINLAAADRGGDVLYQTCGLVPVRRFDAGLGPLPGDGRHEWSGYLPAERMPAWHAPRDGFVVNCNNRPVGPGDPDPWPRFDWPHDRALRIHQRLAGDRSMTLADLASVQNDVVSRGGERFLPRLLKCADSLPASQTPRMRAALDTLRRWDLVARRSRVAPTIYRAWYGALIRRSRLEYPGLAAAALDGRAPEALRAPGSEAPERAATAVIAALDTALTRLAMLLGPDPSTWRWDRAHRARFRHSLTGVTTSSAGRWEPDPVGVDGDNSTPSVGASRLPWNLDVVHGPMFRLLVDLATPDSALGIVPPANAFTTGPASHELLQGWANHSYVPLYLAWDRVERVARSTLTLTPAR